MLGIPEELYTWNSRRVVFLQFPSRMVFLQFQKSGISAIPEGGISAIFWKDSTSAILEELYTWNSRRVVFLQFSGRVVHLQFQKSGIPVILEGWYFCNSRRVVCLEFQKGGISAIEWYAWNSRRVVFLNSRRVVYLEFQKGGISAIS